MLPPLTARSRWLRLLNYALVFAVAGILAVTFLQRARQLQRDAERYTLETSETHLRHAVFLHSSRVLGESGPAGLVALIGANPLHWADWSAGPSSSDIADADQAARSAAFAGWRFDGDRHELVYTPRLLPGGERRWSVQARYDDLDGDQQLDWPEEVPVELRLVRRGPHHDARAVD